MKFKIRFADYIVGFFVVLAVLIVIFVIIMLGNRQQWFSRKYNYQTFFDSGVGLSSNMALNYKGFPIGKVKSVELTVDDRVMVDFFIYDTYNDRAREGSLIELVVSPIGLGNQLLFHPGRGTMQLYENAFIPSVGSPEGLALMDMGLSTLSGDEDSIAKLLGKVSTLLDDLDAVLVQVQQGFAGTDQTALGRILGGVEQTIADVNGITGPLEESLLSILDEANTLMVRINEDGILSTVVDGDGTLYTSLEDSLASISAILNNLDKTTAILPSQVPGLISEVRTALQSAEDVLIALTNNPLLRKGIPDRVHSGSSGTNPRDLSF
ncbi:MlaD family protein [Breznakiella homolactica]|uniref:MCE family protein n=1 Tax=Breznakiella homolactica TaxID=2798577 RepID=A0A7T7XMR1_9SPIR|nr:MlaD family protein [Breznakiella homolactica]QQO09211.1 MlaD family protein [Breznakiella homolactica]